MSDTSKSPTPETDKSEREVAEILKCDGFCDADDMRVVEQQRDEALAKVKELEQQIGEEQFNYGEARIEVDVLKSQLTLAHASCAVKQKALDAWEYYSCHERTQEQWDKCQSAMQDARLSTPLAAQQMAERLVRMEKALGYYADDATYVEGEYGYMMIAPIECDKGERAKQALSTNSQPTKEK